MKRTQFNLILPLAVVIATACSSSEEPCPEEDPRCDASDAGADTGGLGGRGEQPQGAGGSDETEQGLGGESPAGAGGASMGGTVATGGAATGGMGTGGSTTGGTGGTGGNEPIDPNAVCGNGIREGGGEDCDDGNSFSGDGCNANCQQESGFTCTTHPDPCPRTSRDECQQKVNVTYRDFSNAHSDFDVECIGANAVLGLVESTLVNGRPVGSTKLSSDPETYCVENFDQWYQDTAESTSFPTMVTLFQHARDLNYATRLKEDGTRWDNQYDGSPFFFPVDGIPEAKDDGGETAAISTSEYGMNGAIRTELELTGEGPLHNFGFTSDFSFHFRLHEETKGSIEVVGDDDIWVFVNGQLAIDLGGLHGAESGSIAIEGATPAFGMKAGKVYEARVFHAERKPSGSSFRLSTSGLEFTESTCFPD